MLGNLSAKAKLEVNKLQAQIEQLVQADRVREPKLSVEERAEVSHWEVEQKRLTERLDELENQLNTKTERLNDLNSNAISMVIDGLNANELALEFLVARQTVEILRGAVNAAYLDREQAGENVRRIKNGARERENHE